MNPFNRPSRLALCVTLLASATACGGSDESSGDDEPLSTSAASDVGVADSVVEPAADSASEPDGSDDAATELPQFDSDFSRVCDTQVGFGGATPLSADAGPRPVILFQESDSGLLIESSAELPAGWRIDADLDFEDNSELQPLQMVACSSIVAQTANGTSCELEGDDGSTITLDLVDVTYEMTVYEATTGATIGTETIEAASDRCPSFVFVDVDQTELLNTPSEDQYISALKSYVTPG